MCLKLSNSGNPLKLLVPSCSRKAISGPINHWCRVISQKMKETEMGYRGSKSVTGLYKLGTVKEQRVDGSWPGLFSPCLRYTLMDFERNYQIRILSNQINPKNPILNRQDYFLPNQFSKVLPGITKNINYYLYRSSFLQAWLIN